MFPTSYKLLGTQIKASEESYELSFKITGDWQSGFNGEIAIKNISDKPIEDWQLEFDFDYNITSFNEADILSHEGNHYVIKNRGYNANIQAGQTLTLGFGGNPGNVQSQPENYVLIYAGMEDEEEIDFVELPDGKIDKEYYEKAIYPNLIIKGIDPKTILLADDFDGDGLNLKDEYDFDTNPFSADTDDDGLNDYDEVNVYKTLPYYWDTDDDGMSDGTEVDCGLNPLLSDSDSNGVLDNQEVVTQNVRIESINNINIEDTLVKPQVQITGKGDFSRQLYVEDISYDKTITDINCLVGHPFDFVHEDDLNFESSKLTFSISNQALEENNLEDLAIAWYDEVNNSLEILDTKYDMANNSISADVDHYSKYVVINLIDYLYDIDWANKSPIIKNGKADVVFVIDTTGSMGEPINNVKNNINQFVTELKDNNVDVRLGLVEYKDIYADGMNSTKQYDWYKNITDFKSQVAALGIYGGGDTPESAVDALNSARNMKFRNGVNKYIILITDANYKNGIVENPKATMEDEISKLSLFNISTSVVTSTGYYSTYNELVTKTDGVKGNIYNNFATELRPLIAKMGSRLTTVVGLDYQMVLLSNLIKTLI